MQQKYKPQDFTAEERYGFDMWVGVEQDPHYPLKDGDAVRVGSAWVTAINGLVEDGKLYRRPLPLGNTPGKEPEWRLVGWSEATTGTDEFQFNKNPNWTSSIGTSRNVSVWVGGYPAIKAVRRRIATPAREQQKATPLCDSRHKGWQCTEAHGHAGEHVAGRTLTNRKGEVIVTWPQEPAPAAAEPTPEPWICEATAMTGAAEPTQASGMKWVRVEDGMPDRDDTRGAYAVQWNQEGHVDDNFYTASKIHLSKAGVAAWCKVVLPPAPPLRPKPCCADWIANIKEVNESNYCGKTFAHCPWCGKPRPDAKEATK